MRRALTLLGRALLLRCPNCGSRKLFGRRFKLNATCPDCGLRVEREGGNFTGSITINLVVSETLWALTFVAFLLATWPNPPVALLQWGSVVLMVLFPVLFYPFSKTLWLALDLLMRPLPAGERESGKA
jgi:uncharacterized protein (DUF983 family)